MQVCKYASMQLFNHAIMQVCKYGSMHVCSYAVQVCKYEANMQVCQFGPFVVHSLPTSCATMESHAFFFVNNKIQG